MKKSSVVIIILVCIFSVFLGIKYLNDSEKYVSVDAIKFKEEYEKLNGEINTNNSKKYPEVKISDDNVIKYSSYEEILEILKTGSGVIYFGFPECPWCRSLVPVLMSAATETEIDVIYYLNIKEDRNLLILDGNKKIKTQKEGSKDYFKLVDALSEILDDYVLTTNDGEEVNTNTKRIYLPLVVFVKEGKIIDYHVDTVATQEDPYKALSDREVEELLMELINKISKTTGIICDEHC